MVAKNNYTICNLDDFISRCSHHFQILLASRTSKSRLEKSDFPGYPAISLLNSSVVLVDNIFRIPTSGVILDLTCYFNPLLTGLHTNAVDMKKKSDNNKSANEADLHSGISQSDNSAYEVEEQVFVRQNYENTSSFEMDIEKAKAMVTASQQEVVERKSVAPAVLDDGETDAIKRSLAELREVEKKLDDDMGDESPGLLQRIKNLFSS